MKKSEIYVIDLFCCAGGASEGYARAGFTVNGIDNDLKALKHYPYRYKCVDIKTVTARFLRRYDLIHASPPCQAHTDLRSRTGKDYEDLIPFTRDLLVTSGKPYVIENVESTNDHLIDPITLCGTNFGLGAICKDGAYRQLWRHREFESNFEIRPHPRGCMHAGQPIGVYGDGGGGQQTRGYKAYAAEGLDAMDIRHYTPRKYVSQAIPPAFTEYIGHEFLRSIDAI